MRGQNYFLRIADAVRLMLFGLAHRVRPAESICRWLMHLDQQSQSRAGSELTFRVNATLFTMEIQIKTDREESPRFRHCILVI